MIETLPGLISNAQDFVHDIIKKTTYTSTAHAGSFCLQIEQLSDKAG
jgi:hypothetical protein